MGDTLHSIAIKSRGFLSFSNHGIWVPTPLDILKCHGLKNTKTSQHRVQGSLPAASPPAFCVAATVRPPKALLPQWSWRSLQGFGGMAPGHLSWYQWNGGTKTAKRVGLPSSHQGKHPWIGFPNYAPPFKNCGNSHGHVWMTGSGEYRLQPKYELVLKC